MPCLSRQDLAKHGRSVYGFWVQMTSNGLKTVKDSSWIFWTLGKISLKLVNCELQPLRMGIFALNYFELNSVQMVSNCFKTLGNPFGACSWILGKVFSWSDSSKSWSKWVPIPYVRVVWLGLFWIGSGSKWSLIVLKLWEIPLELLPNLQGSFHLHWLPEVGQSGS